MAEHVVERTRRAVRRRSETPQERNRLWWEALPMTYGGWEDAERIPQSAEDFRRVDQRFLEGNPWLLRELDFGAQAGRDVLEIGCGCGSASCLFARGGARVTAVDLTAQAVELTRANARGQGLAVAALRSDAESLAVPDASFDYVFSWGVIHHSHRTERAIAEIARVLRPGGGGLVMVYNRNSLRFWLHGLFWLVFRGRLLAGDDLVSVQRHYTDGFYQRHFRPAELRDAFAREGLVTERVSLTHMAKPMLPGLPAAVDAWLKRKAGWLLVLEFRKPARAPAG